MEESPNPRLIAEDEFVSVQPALIRALDGKVADALVLQYLWWWQRLSQNEMDGYTWVYNTYEQWSDRLGISTDQFKRIILRLEEQRLVISCKPDAGQWKHRKWYRVNTDHKFWLTLTLNAESDETTTPIDRAISPNRSGDFAESRSGDFAHSSIYTESTYREDGPSSLQKPKETSRAEDGTTQDKERVTPGAAPLSHPSSITPTPEDGIPQDHRAPANSTGRPGLDDEPDPEVVRLCELLADLYQANGNTRPNPHQKKWYQDCRLLLTKDGPDGKGRPPDKAEALLRWSLNHHFWKSNIQSMPNFRKHYDKMREQALEEHRSKAPKQTAQSKNIDYIAQREEQARQKEQSQND